MIWLASRAAIPIAGVGAVLESGRAPRARLNAGILREHGTYFVVPSMPTRRENGARPGELLRQTAAEGRVSLERPGFAGVLRRGDAQARASPLSPEAAMHAARDLLGFRGDPDRSAIDPGGDRGQSALSVRSGIR
ncbi:MAG: hypothetical protein U5L11_00565 [Arhodomonas sp.]|nr:hypothetical protein [Arhodomonas sp.]